MLKFVESHPAAPKYQPALTYKPVPTYKPTPKYHPAPTYKPAPKYYKPAPKYYKPAPTYSHHPKPFLAAKSYPGVRKYSFRLAAEEAVEQRNKEVVSVEVAAEVKEVVQVRADVAEVIRILKKEEERATAQSDF